VLGKYRSDSGSRERTCGADRTYPRICSRHPPRRNVAGRSSGSWTGNKFSFTGLNDPRPADALTSCAI
jgi:hypothetical protein